MQKLANIMHSGYSKQPQYTWQTKTKLKLAKEQAQQP